MKVRPCILLAFAVPFSVVTKVSGFPPEHRRAIEASRNFHSLGRTSDSPAEVLSLVTGREGKIAEPTS